MLVVRDVTSIVMNENIMETKREMAKMTDQLVTSIENSANVTEQKLQKLDQYISDQAGMQINDETLGELKKMQYRIKDFQQVYNISENKFRHQAEAVNIRQTIDEVQGLLMTDCRNRSIELKTHIDSDVPDVIACDHAKFKQVLLNLLQ